MGPKWYKYPHYQRYGVLEYYVYDPGGTPEEPGGPSILGWQREDAGEEFSEIEQMDGWRRPCLGITFRRDPERGLDLLRPDGQRFESYHELSTRVEQFALIAEQNAQRAERLAAQLRAAGIEPDGVS